MIPKHLSETEIQQVVLNETASTPYANEHMRICEHCRMRSETYRILFSAIRQEQKPSFDFDLSELVLPQLKEPTAKSTPAKYLIGWFLMVVSAIIFIAGYIGRSYITAAFRGVSTIAIYTMVITTLLLIVFQMADLYRQYLKRMKILNPT